MSIKRFIRGDSSLDLEAVGDALRENCGFEEVELTPMDGENWLSIPLVLNDEYFVKVVSEQNTVTHSFFTTMRNLGARLSGNGPFFETYGSPVEMARHEFDATVKMREAGVNAPEPVDVVKMDGGALILIEFLEEFETLSEVEHDEGTVREVFENLRLLHDSGLAHGDFSLENVLVVDGEVYFIDSTNIMEDGREDAVAYDLACALGSFATTLPAETVVRKALEFYTVEEVRHALDFLVVVRLRPGVEDSFSILGLRDAVARLAHEFEEENTDGEVGFAEGVSGRREDEDTTT